ncbi:hypothetical protein LNQ03_25265 [Klebsiella pneumoniae subsp. pneumoniae]|nr:hypothetical protein [Klebsiella pneumoniae subsp. pneumoniae]
MLWRWLCSKGYEVLVEQQIAHELQLSNVKTGTLAEIGQQADLARDGGGRRRQYARRGADLARYDINVIGINRGNLGFSPTLTRTTPCSSSPMCWKATTSPRNAFCWRPRCVSRIARNVSSTAINEVVLHPGKVAHMIEFEVYIDEVFAFSQRSDRPDYLHSDRLHRLLAVGRRPIRTPSLDAITLVPMFPHTLSARPLGDQRRRHHPPALLSPLRRSWRSAATARLPCRSRMAKMSSFAAVIITSI